MEKTLIEITLFSPFVVKTPKREKGAMKCRSKAGYSSSSVSSSSSACASSSSSEETRAGPMPKAANLAGVNEP
jgi:hypothetical protein